MIFIPLLTSLGLFSPIPYNRGERLQLTFDEGYDINYKANFYKNGCSFYRLAVYGFNLGEWEVVYATDPTGEKGDRTKGWQTLNLMIKGEPKYLKYEIRTEHTCGDIDERVLRIFDRFKYKDIQ